MVRDSRRFIAAAVAYLLFGPISHAAALAVTTPLMFVQEYVRELGELETLRAQAESELKSPGQGQLGPFITEINYGTRLQTVLDSDMAVLNGMRLDAPNSELPTQIASFEGNERSIHAEMVAIAKEMVSLGISGPKAGIDYSAFATRLPQLRAFLQENAKLYVRASGIAFFMLVDMRPDDTGRVSRLTITVRERKDLQHQLIAAFSEKKLKEKNVSGMVNAAGLLYDLLNKPYKCSDES